MTGRQISYQVRNLIIKDCERGVSQRKIAEKYEVSKSAVQKLHKKFLSTGTVADRSGRGKTRSTSWRDDAMIVRIVKKDPRTTVRNLRESLILSISDRTVRRRLQEVGLQSRFARKRPLINNRNKKKRLEFAKKYANQPVEFWKRVLWTDESKFELIGLKQRLRVWRKTGEELEDRHLQKTVKYGGGSIMVWGCFSWEGVGHLIKIDGIMTADTYIDILCENLEVSLLQLGLENSFILQQDNDPKHTAKKTKKFLTSSHIKLLDWPPQSPDLNPIENLWSILDRNVNKTGVTNKNNYFNTLQRSWESLDINYLHNLVESMPRRLAAVIKAKGGHTKY
ncbi:Transposable element Tc1 transposase [Anthophora quadrimaculata]